MSAPEMILFTGIQATGKSEFYKRRFYKTHIRINLDMLKTRRRESILMNACLQAGQSFVLDNTNPTRVDRAAYMAAAHEAGFTVTGYYFQSRIADCIARNAGREGKERVPDKALHATHAKLEIPAWDEGYDALYYVAIDDGGEFIVEAFSDEV